MTFGQREEWIVHHSQVPSVGVVMFFFLLLFIAIFFFEDFNFEGIYINLV
jgi:hypothetical protein